jgi:hypothetical protein
VTLGYVEGSISDNFSSFFHIATAMSDFFFRIVHLSVVVVVVVVVVVRFT